MSTREKWPKFHPNIPKPSMVNRSSVFFFFFSGAVVVEATTSGFTKGKRLNKLAARAKQENAGHPQEIHGPLYNLSISSLIGI